MTAFSIPSFDVRLGCSLRFSWSSSPSAALIAVKLLSSVTGWSRRWMWSDRPSRKMPPKGVGKGRYCHDTLGGQMTVYPNPTHWNSLAIQVKTQENCISLYTIYKYKKHFVHKRTYSCIYRNLCIQCHKFYKYRHHSSSSCSKVCAKKNEMEYVFPYQITT